MSWEDGKGGREVSWAGGKGGRVVRWQGTKSGRIFKCKGWRGGRVARWQGEKFLVLLKIGGRRVSPRPHLFSDVSQRNEGAGWVKDFLAWPQRWKDSP